MDGWAFLTLIFNGIGTLHYKHDLEQRTVTTVRDRRGAPQCMDQYRLMFSTTRIPCKDVDKLQFYPPQVSRHIVVICDGQFFKVPCYDKKGEMINLETLEKTLGKIDKIIVDGESTGSIVPYLPLPEIKKRVDIKKEDIE